MKCPRCKIELTSNYCGLHYRCYFTKNNHYEQFFVHNYHFDNDKILNKLLIFKSKDGSIINLNNYYNHMLFVKELLYIEDLSIFANFSSEQIKNKINILDLLS